MDRTGKPRLLEEAFDLVIRLQADPGNPVALELIRAWRAKSAEHEEAWAEAAEIYGMTGHILRRDAERESGVDPARRRLLKGGTLGLVAVAAGLLAGPGLVLRARADLVTATAETRSVALPDGSTAILGPRTAVAFDFSETSRRVDLLEGMALFDIRSGAGLPFQAAGGNAVASTSGARFDLACEGDALTVSVERDSVDIAFAGGIAGEHIEAGHWLSYDAGSTGKQHGSRRDGGIAAWRDGTIVADGQRVSTVVAQIGRWERGQIVIADPTLGAGRVSGIFDLGNPIEALRAVVHPYGGTVRQVTPLLTVISRV